VRAVIAALAANLAIAVAKFAAFLISGSASMLAESVHSFADTANELLLLIGQGRSRRQRTMEHQFGFGRERYFYSFVVAVMLFTIGAAFSIYDGVNKIIHPGTVDSPAIAFIVLGVSAILEGFSLRTAVKEANEARDTDMGWRDFVHATKSAELPVVLMEDSAALCGLLFAFLGVLLAVLTGNDAWDGAGSVAVGALLACAAFIVGYESKSLLIGESATPADTAQIVGALEDGPEEFRVIHLRTTHISPDLLLVTAKIAVPPEMRMSELSSGIDAAEKRVRAVLPIAEIIYLEPDIYRSGADKVTDPSVRAVRRGRLRLRADLRSARARRSVGGPADGVANEESGGAAGPVADASPDGALSDISRVRRDRICPRY
jgi:cation diffusion facilitator family transporter